MSLKAVDAIKSPRRRESDAPSKAAEERASCWRGTLAIAEGAACLVVTRRTWQGGQPLTQVVLTYPGDRHHLVARFSPARGKFTYPTALTTAPDVRPNSASN